MVTRPNGGSLHIQGKGGNTVYGGNQREILITHFAHLLLMLNFFNGLNSHGEDLKGICAFL